MGNSHNQRRNESEISNVQMSHPSHMGHQLHQVASMPSLVQMQQMPQISMAQLQQQYQHQQIQQQQQSASQHQPQVVQQTVVPAMEPYTTDPSLILPPFLFLGGGYLNRNPQAANYFGITHVLNMAVELTPHPELFNTRQIKYKHIPADDSLYYNIRFHFDEAFELIDDARNSGGKILVHCAMGISRSATIVIAYIMSRYKVPLKTAYEFVKSRRKEVRPNPLFMKILEDYDRELYQSEIEEYNQRRKSQLFTMNSVSVPANGNNTFRSYSYMAPTTALRRDFTYPL